MYFYFSIYQAAHEPGTIQIPIGNNTGSLPDLTNVHFQHNNNSLDQDQSSSPYSSVSILYLYSSKYHLEVPFHISHAEPG